MARGATGALLRPDGSIFVGNVTLVDPRLQNLREFLIDLSRPGVCIVLGAGASRDLVPNSPPAIAGLALDIIRAQAQGAVPLLTSEQRRMAAGSPEIRYLIPILRDEPVSSWDRVILANLSKARAVVACSDLFTPSAKVPQSLIKIYDVIENAGGSIVSFNYDGVDRQQRRFPVIHPHGQRPESLVDPVVGPLSRKLALAHGYAPSVNWHLPVPENSAIQTHGDYRAMVRAWRAAAAIVLVGYRFGWGMDGYSFADFGGVLRADTRVHVLCPKPDNADLRKQVREALKHRGIHVFGQPFSWRNFAESALRLLREHRDRHVSYLIGHEPAFLRQHDHELPPLEAPKSSGTPPTIRDEVLLNVRSDHFTAFGEHRAFPLDELCFE